MTKREKRTMSTKLVRVALGVVPICLLAACGAEVDPSGHEPATAAAAAAAPASGAATANLHCVSSSTGPAKCYASFTDAIAAATGGEIVDAPADPRAALDDPRFAARLDAIAQRRAADLESGVIDAQVKPAATVVIGISYLDANYGGNTWVWNEAYGCDGNSSTIDFSVANLNTSPYSRYGFNDSISSFHSFSNCKTVLYDDWYWGGAATTGGIPVADLSYVGDAMNDRASSIRWY
jgi:hypothetical protein